MLDATVETPITDRGLEWCEDILAGRIPSCKRVRLACERFKRDLARQGTDAFPFVFDASLAEHLCGFIQGMPHIKGKWALSNETLNLLGWQAFLFAQINGWVHRETGLRRFQTVYVEVPRKNGKSTCGAPLGLYFLTVDGEPGAEVYSAASSSDQARIVFDAARNMARLATVDGQPLADLLGLGIEEHKIKLDGDDAAVFRPIASQTKSKDGKNPHCALIDELHEHEKRDVWDSMENALGSREQPLLFAITTAGHDTSGVCYEQRRYVERILDQVFHDEAYLGLIFEADEGDDPGDPATWAKANPSLGEAKSLDSMEKVWAKAKASPAALGEFLRKHLNIWTSVGASAFDMDGWRAGAKPDVSLKSFAGRKAYIGVDLATRQDPSSVVLTIPDGNEAHVFSWHFLPEKIVNAEGNEHLWGWHEAGHLHTTPGAELDLNIVEALVLSLAGMGNDDWGWADLPSFEIEAVVYDAMYAAQMAATWEQSGLNAIELRSRAANLNEPFNKVIASIEDRRVFHDDNPVLTWMVANTLAKRVQGGDYIFPAKLHPEDKIDGVIAMTNTFFPMCSVPEDDKKSKKVGKGFIDV